MIPRTTLGYCIPWYSAKTPCSSWWEYWLLAAHSCLSHWKLPSAVSNCFIQGCPLPTGRPRTDEWLAIEYKGPASFPQFRMSLRGSCNFQSSPVNLLRPQTHCRLAFLSAQPCLCHSLPHAPQGNTLQQTFRTQLSTLGSFLPCFQGAPSNSVGFYFYFTFLLKTSVVPYISISSFNIQPTPPMCWNLFGSWYSCLLYLLLPPALCHWQIW